MDLLLHNPSCATYISCRTCALLFSVPSSLDPVYVNLTYFRDFAFATTYPITELGAQEPPISICDSSTSRTTIIICIVAF
ncbi:hypothetical protein L5515_001166 [Caenorhabditis briggsae]|uniref:Uncharacterized protein n=1 Tax=Caenorhabditis briggsae TaxID=6238 RepID=A0AAE9J3B2_CAEBR|nr:hypothetical protein L5515_001166 [Caenorhabditis briggsae]